MTVSQLRKMLNNAGIDYYIKKENGNILKINIWIDDEELENETQCIGGACCNGNCNGSCC